MTKNTFIFQTGHGKRLAKAEIESLGGKILDDVMDGFLVELDPENTLHKNPTQLQRRMGGIVRVAEVVQSGPAAMPLNFEEWSVRALEDYFKDKTGKFRFGISTHPKSEKILKKMLIGAKKTLKKSVGNLRFVNKDFQNLSSVQAWHEGLLKDNGIELQLFRSEEDRSPEYTAPEKWYLARTIGIQNFESYSKRDYDRPAKSAKNGMFPPKLAQILINIATEGQTIAVFDPFCGSGTVLQEAWLREHESIGSDLVEQMVEDSKENLDWLKFQFKLEGAPPVVFQADATKLTADQLPKDAFAIVTETWLGPALQKPLSELERPKVQREIEALYEDFFSNLAEVKKSRTSKDPFTIVFTAPYHRTGNERHFLPNLPDILKKYTKIIPLSDHERPSLFYERKGQLVSREIWKVAI